MAGKSSISRQPEEVRVKITALRDQGRTIDEILAALNAIDVDVSRSSLGRHVKKMDQVADRLRRSRELAESIGRKFGDAETSQVQRTNVELLHSILMQTMIGDDEQENVVLKPQEAMFLSKALDHLSRASKTDLETQLKAAEERARREAAENAADKAEQVARKSGLSADFVNELRSKILGVE